jgi:hypothetical protein
MEGEGKPAPPLPADFFCRLLLRSTCSRANKHVRAAHVPRRIPPHLLRALARARRGARARCGGRVLCAMCYACYMC